MLDIRQNKNYAKYLQEQNWIAEKHEGVFYYIKKVFFFSAIKIQRPKKINLEFIEKLAKKYRAIQVFIEPKTPKEASMLAKKGWQLSFPFLPSKTVMLQLNKPVNKLYESFNKDTRYSIRKSEQLKVYKEKDLESFRHYWKKAVSFQRHVLKTKQMKGLRESFGKNSLFLVAQDGISGAIFLVAGNVGYYWYGFVGQEGRKKLSQYKIVWEGIKWAKGRGAKYFDMEGIYDDRFPISTWQGFTKFKKSFGGKQFKFPGAYRKFYIHRPHTLGGRSI